MICKKCGAEINDDAVVCVKCGCTVTETPTQINPAKKSASKLQIAAKIFMIIACISLGWSIIPLLWLIPMTTSYNRKIENGEPISLGFKICTILFSNPIAGILMLIDGQ